MGTEETLTRILQELQKPDFATPALYFFSAVAQTMGAIIAIVLTGVFAIIPQIQQRNNNPGSNVLIKALKRDDNFLNAVYFGFSVILLSIIGLILIYITGQNQPYCIFLLFILALPTVVLGVISCFNLWIFVSIKITIYGHLINFSSHIIQNIHILSKKSDDKKNIDGVNKEELDSKKSLKVVTDIEATYIEALILTDSLYPNYKNGSKRLLESIIFINDEDIYLQALNDLHTDVVSMGPILNHDDEQHFYNNLFELLWLLPIELGDNCISEISIKNHAIMNAIFLKCDKEKIGNYINIQIEDITWRFKRLSIRDKKIFNIPYYLLRLMNIRLFLLIYGNTINVNLHALISIFDELIDKSIGDDKSKSIFHEYGELLFVYILKLLLDDDKVKNPKQILMVIDKYKIFKDSIYFDDRIILKNMNINVIGVALILFLLEIKITQNSDTLYTLPKKDLLCLIRKFYKKRDVEVKLNAFLNQNSFITLHEKDSTVFTTKLDESNHPFKITTRIEKFGKSGKH